MSGIATDLDRWHETLSLVADRLREDFSHSYPFKNDGDVSPSLVALRDAFHAFPVSADVLLIDAGPKQSVGHYGSVMMGANFSAGPIWTLIAHHMADTSRKEVRFHGSRKLTDLDSYLPLLAEFKPAVSCKGCTKEPPFAVLLRVQHQGHFRHVCFPSQYGIGRKSSAKK